MQWHRLPYRADPLQLVSFQVQDINVVHHLENASVNVGGILSIGVSRNTTFFPSLHSPSFTMMPGFSILTIVFEGVYFESEDRLLCLLGNAALPISDPHVEYWDITNSHWSGFSHQPRLLQDDQILLVLRYPQTFNLTSRAIKGEIRSLNKHGSLKYFDNVHISSQLSRYSTYHFSPELMPRPCDDKHFCQGEWALNDALTFSGSEFCKTLRSISEPFNVIPNYLLNNTTSIRERNQPSKFRLLKQSSFLKYPALKDEQDVLGQLSFLSSNLNFDAYAICKHCLDKHNSRVFIHMDVFSLGPVFGPHVPAGTEKLTNTQLLNISSHLIFNEGSSVFTNQQYRHLSPLFLEGVYDPLAGEMYLIGCRMVSNMSTNVGHGLDCLVDVKVQYPPLIGRWLKNPSVEITITSQRHENDPLHFNAVTLQTDIVPYLNHQDDVAFRKLFERVLRILLSCALVGIICSQLSYMKRNVTSIPHISLVMVAEQILGYVAELLRGTEILLESKESASYKDLSHDYKLILNPLEIITRLLVLVSLLLTIRLYKKVLEAKRRSNAYGSDKEKRLPQNKNVLLWNLKVHIVVCLVLTAVLAIELSLKNNLRSLGLIDVLLLPGIFIQQVHMHVLWAQDFFLIPQALQKSVWQSKVKPLRKMYYVGLTLLRLILYSYDYIRDPILEPYSDNGVFNRMSSNFFSIYGFVMVFMLISVHIQQSRNIQKSFCS
uniref:RING-type E3 ubiquitin transferase n=1 Tax=Cajanus cajan TaxID=3821 RepID=A0A151R5Y2_CAJCA|nr:hypothetical protein KK1_040838 [Cajanus cajan]